MKQESVITRLRGAGIALGAWLYAQAVWAIKVLEFEIEGVDSEDPVEMAGQLVVVLVTLVVAVLGVAAIVLVIIQLLKQVAEAREDGKWGNVVRTALFGIGLLVFVAWLIALVTGLLT